MTLTTPVTKKAKKAMKGTGIPVLFGTAFDPVKSGVVKSLAHHSDNITGIKVGGNTQKALDLLIAIAPGTKRIFVPVKYDTQAASLSITELKSAAKTLKVDLLISEVSTLEELQAAFSSMPEDVNGIFIVNSIFIASNIKHIIDASIKIKIPVGAATHVYRHGAVVSYSQRGQHSGEQASRLAHKMLQGTPASSLPVETADFFLGINLKTANSIGLEIPYDILDQADFIIR
jgi:putative ABC transport system substrate-binding protein